MSNELTTQGAGTTVGHANEDPFAVGTEDIYDELTFVKFSGQTGEWSFNDTEEIEEGTVVAMDLFNTAGIWTFWWDGAPIEQNTVLHRDNPRLSDQEPKELPEDEDGVIDMTYDEIMEERENDDEFREGWAYQISVGFRMPSDAEYADDNFVFRLGSNSGIRAVKGLLKAFSRKYKFNQGKIPLVEIGAKKAEKKVTQANGKKKVIKWVQPTFKIVGWISEAVLEGAEDEASHDVTDTTKITDVVDVKDLPVAEVSESEPKEEVTDAADTEETPKRGRGRARGGNY